MPRLRLSEVPGLLSCAFEAADPDHPSKVKERRKVVLLEHMLRSIAEGRYDELREFMAPDISFEYVAPPDMPWVRRASGVEAVTAAIANNFGHVRDQRPEPLALVAQGEIVVLMIRETGRWVETGEPYDVVVAQQFTFREDQLTGFRAVAGYANASVAGDS